MTSRTYSDYEKAQHARGVEFAKTHHKDQLQPEGDDADSAAFMLGWSQKMHDIDFGPLGDDFEGDIGNALAVLGLGPEYYWPLRMLDRKLFIAILNLVEKSCADEEEQAA